MTKQLTFEFAGIFRRDPIRAIAAVRELRDNAQTLKSRAARGGYENTDVSQFWNLLSEAPAVLLVRPADLSKAAGLGSSYFQSAVKERRYPKLHNFLKCLSAIIEAADNLLTVIDGPRGSGDADWVPNPIQFDDTRIVALQHDLLELIVFLRQTNKLSDIPEIDEYWRQSLIKILETIVAMLKGPLLEPTLLRKASSMLKSLGSDLVGDARNGFVAAIAAAAAVALMELAKR